MTPLWPRGHVVGGRRVEHWTVDSVSMHTPGRWRVPRLVTVEAPTVTKAATAYLAARASALDHRFLLLLSDYWPALGWRDELENIILAAPVSDQIDADRLIPALLDCPARWRAVVLDGSAPVSLNDAVVDDGGAGEWHADFLHCDVGPEDDQRWHGRTLDLVIVAGQTQDHRFPPGLRDHAAPCDLRHVRSARDQCEAAGVPFVIARLGSRVHASAAPLAGPQSAESIMRHGEYDPDPWEMSFRSRTGADPSEWPEDLEPYAAAAGPLAGGEP